MIILSLSFIAIAQEIVIKILLDSDKTSITIFSHSTKGLNTLFQSNICAENLDLKD